jgi:hypothetical protein
MRGGFSVGDAVGAGDVVAVVVGFGRRFLFPGAGSGQPDHRDDGKSARNGGGLMSTHFGVVNRSLADGFDGAWRSDS